MRISVTSLILLFLTAPILGACGLWSEPPPGAIQPAPAPGKVIDPDDSALTQAIAEFVKTTEAPASTGYNYVRHDLNDDGRRDALVYLKSPYGYWCGTHGCAILVFQAHNDRFTLINAIQPVRGPVHISVMKSNGWKNLVVRVSGRSNKAKDVAMLFDGQKYPSDPSKLPPFPKKNYNGYTRIFMKD
ncbi:MAG: hypothetical protein R3E13_03535 [Alphaproteobacteria bacterium]